jgi:hypothetical protein
MRRRRKRKSNMTTKLACLTEVLSSSPSTRDISTTNNLSQNISVRMTKGRCQMVEDGVTARAADEEHEGEVEAAETGSRRV